VREGVGLRVVEAIRYASSCEPPIIVKSVWLSSVHTTCHIAQVRGPSLARSRPDCADRFRWYPANAAVPALLKRPLIPLTGTETTAATIRALLDGCAFGPETELVTIHAFTPHDMPPFADHNPHAANAWLPAFRDRYAPAGAQTATIEMRCGRVEQVISEVAETINATLTVVSWSQELSPNHGRLVEALLAHANRPTLLLPSDYQPQNRGHDPAAGTTAAAFGPGRPRTQPRSARVRDNQHTSAE